MSSELSDSGWWRPPPVKPPPKISTSGFVIGGIVLAAIVAGVAFALLDQRPRNPSTASSAPVRSLAAFTSCLKSQGVLIPSAEFNDAMLRPAAVACRTYVPLVGASKDPAAAAQNLYEACQQDAQSKLRKAQFGGGIGGPASGLVNLANASSARAAYQQDTAVCRAQSFDEPGGGSFDDGRPSGPSSGT
jgi:hypothetical protein